jgi:hypothetical protein
MLAFIIVGKRMCDAALVKRKLPVQTIVVE